MSGDRLPSDDVETSPQTDLDQAGSDGVDGMGVRAGKLLLSRGCKSAEEVLAAFSEATVRPAESLRCLNPECDQWCLWKRDGGRPTLFCRRACRDKYFDTRAVLLVEVERLEAALSQGVTHRTARKLQSELALRRWSLSRYPDLGSSGGQAGAVRD